jgi:multiple sugar transport system ATP-binding protein
MASLNLKSLRKSYDGMEVVHGIDLAIDDKEFVVLVGPSGCGKSTTLRMIAGLEEISAGEIWIGERQVNELEAKDRNIAMVFQDYALYPHMSVFDNMAFGLQYRGYKKDEIRRRVLEAAEILNIGELLRRRPRQLSGGQRQRVAMGRAIVRDPTVFLYDEPLSNLDAKLRLQMRTEIKKLHQRVATTVVYVTHDQVEAMTLADRIVLMRAGHIEQIGSPDEIYNSPVNTYVAGFIGAPTMNLVPARLSRADAAGLMLNFSDNRQLALNGERHNKYSTHIDQEVIFGLRPEAFSLQNQDVTSGRLDIVAEVIEPLGSDTLVFFRVTGQELVARLPPGSVRRAGEAVTLYPDLSKMHLFDAATQRAI